MGPAELLIFFFVLAVSLVILGRVFLTVVLGSILGIHDYQLAILHLIRKHGNLVRFQSEKQETRVVGPIP